MCRDYSLGLCVYGEDKRKRDPPLFLGTDEEVVPRLIILIESELGEIPPIKLHCPPATVQVFLEAISGYLEKEGEIELSSRAKSLIPQISEYYKRGEEKE
jgi:hypothetical protein